MLVDHFPMLGLRITSGDIELRLPEPEELSALADLAAEGVHDPATMPFLRAWTDRPPAERARSVLQDHWSDLGSWRPERWKLPLAVFRRGEPTGIQMMKGVDFAVLKEVESGSWLGRRFHGQGIGTRMRGMMLHLAFEGLGAEAATTLALEHNKASHAVTMKNGYVPNGFKYELVRGEKTMDRSYRLDRDRWERHRRPEPVEIHGLESCLELFGANGKAAA